MVVTNVLLSLEFMVLRNKKARCIDDEWTREPKTADPAITNEVRVPGALPLIITLVGRIYLPMNQ